MFGKKKPDGEVTVDCDGMKVTGSYTLKRGKLLLKADGFEETAVNAAVLGGEKGKAADNLAKLALVELLKETTEVPTLECGITLHGGGSGGTTAIYC